MGVIVKLVHAAMAEKKDLKLETERRLLCSIVTLHTPARARHQVN